MTNYSKYILFTLIGICVGLGIIGVFVPGIPTTIFFIIALLIFFLPKVKIPSNKDAKGFKGFIYTFYWVNLSFQGRLNRYDLWIYGILIFWILGLAIIFLSIFFMISFDLIFFESLFGILIGIVVLFYLIHIYATYAKRLHDHNKSGWNLLWTFIPILGLIPLIIITIACWFVKGTEGPNDYGPDSVK